ncbi:MAG: trypsin-like peptidase domain-containing protein [Planctomycetota bacterium]
MAMRSIGVIPGLSVALAASFAAGPAVGQSEMPAEIRADVEFARNLSRAFQYAAGQVEKSVVKINAYATRSTRRGMASSFEPRPAGLGSGVIINDAGLVLTNDHVVADGNQYLVGLYDGREVAATLIGRDPQTDIALLTIEADELEAAPFADSDEVEVGEWVIAVGSPFGFSSTVTAGIVSAKGRGGLGEGGSSLYQEFIQTDASINPGNSGGPLVDLEGRIVGINTAIASRTGGSVGIGFAIPSNLALAVVERLLDGGVVERGALGVGLRALTPSESRRVPGGPGLGVVIGNILAGGPAASSGLLNEDVLLRVAGRDVEGVGDEAINRARNLISLIPPGEPAEVEIYRAGRVIETQIVTGQLRDVRLLDRAERVREATGGEAIAHLELGVVLRPLSDREKRIVRVSARSDAELIEYVEPGSPAEDAGLEASDVVVERIERALARGKKLVTLDVRRGRFADRVDIEIDAR